MQPSATNMTDLVQRWYDLAEQDETSTDERKKLYDDTEKVACFLDEIQGSCSALTAKEKIAGLEGELLKAINSHSVGESTRLANWICRHISYKPGSTTEFGGGAYLPLHHLFSALLASTGQGVDSPDMVQFAFIDAAALEYASKQQNLPLWAGYVHELGSNLTIQELLRLRETSPANKDAANLALIHQLNSGQIDNLNELGLETIDQVIPFFGTRCSELLSFKFTFKETEIIEPSTEQTAPPLSESRIFQFSAKKIAEHFQNLTSLNLKLLLFPSRSMIKIQDLHLPHLNFLKHEGLAFDEDCAFDLDCVNNLPMLSTLHANSAPDASALKNCQNLTDLYLTGMPGMPTFDPEYLQGSSSQIKSINLVNYQITDPNCFKKMSQLQNLSLRDCSVKKLELSDLPNLISLDLDRCENLEALQPDCPNLEKLRLSSLDALQELNLSHCLTLILLRLSECSKLKVVEGEGLKSVQKIELRHFPPELIAFLKQCNHLDWLNLENIKEVQIPADTPFPSLTKLAILCPVKEFTFLKNCHNLQTIGLEKLDASIVSLLPASLKNLYFSSYSSSVPAELEDAVEKKGIALTYFSLLEKSDLLKDFQI